MRLFQKRNVAFIPIANFAISFLKSTSHGSGVNAVTNQPTALITNKEASIMRIIKR